MLEICRRSIADQSASGTRQGYGVLSRNAHVTAAQRPRDCRATAVDQSASGTRRGYGELWRNGRATLHVTVRERQGMMSTVVGLESNGVALE